MVAQRTICTFCFAGLLTLRFDAGIGLNAYGEEPPQEPLSTSIVAASGIPLSILHGKPAGKLASVRSLANQPSLPSESQHPLQPLLAEARQALERIERDVHDYTCVLVKRERIAGRLMPQETLVAKVLHGDGKANEEQTPLLDLESDQSLPSEQADCLYLRFEAPEDVRGREILFRQAGDPLKLLVRNGGRRLAFLTLELEPTCPMAMQGNRYPVTEFGIKRLVERMIRLGERELAHAECEVRVDDGVILDDRPCRTIEVLHPHQREHFAYYLARIYVDQELQLPTRFEAFDWPRDGEEQPPLLEDYYYRDVRLNIGLKNEDFVRDNPEYGFPVR